MNWDGLQASRLSAAILDQWPHLRNRVTYHIKPLEAVHLRPDDLAVSIHACGALTAAITPQNRLLLGWPER